MIDLSSFLVASSMTGNSSPSPYGFFRDPLWQFIGVVLAFATIVIAILIPFLGRITKELSLFVLATEPMLDIADRIRDQLKTTYLGKSVSRLHYLCLVLVNTGNAPIKASDFQEAITVSFGAASEILHADAVTAPQNLRTTINLQKNFFALESTLLNPGDSITINALLDKFDGRIKVLSRIEGVPYIKYRTELSDQRIDRRAKLGTAMFLFGWGVLIGSIPSLTQQRIVFFPFVGVGIVIVGILTFFIATLSQRDAIAELIRANRWEKLMVKTSSQEIPTT